MGLLDREANTPRGCLRSVLVVTLLTLVSVSLISVGAYRFVDGACVRDAATWLPPYPGATLVEERATQRPFGVGTTSQRWHTPDAPADVRAFYYSVWEANAAAGLSITNTRAALDRREFRHPDGGTNILFSVSCVPTLDLSQLRLVTTAEPPPPPAADAR